MAGPIRVVIADDSSVSREGLARILASDPAMKVIGQAANGEQALECVLAQRPDVILMDIMMPVMDGLEATRRIMRQAPTPTVLVSNLVGQQGDLNFQGFDAGALDVLRKPSSVELEDAEARARFVRKIKALSQVPVVTRRRVGATPSAPPPAPPVATRSVPPRQVSREASLVVIGASTGGPPAVSRILQSLEPDRTPPVVVVQHMTPGFIQGMAKWLGEACPGLDVRIAARGEVPRPGAVYLAPDDQHLALRGDSFVLHREPAESRHVPSVDVFFESVAAAPAAATTIAALLTGMGSDGARGLLEIRRAGGYTVAQDEASCVVFGMPRAAVELNAAEDSLSLDRIAQCLRGVVYAPRAGRNRRGWMSHASPA